MTMMNAPQEICNSFNNYATSYEAAAKIQCEIADRLLERLSFLKINPRYILDLGCGTGYASVQLKKRYPDACIISLDCALGMLKQTRKKQGWFSKWPLINADMMKLPFMNNLFDLVFSNQVIHWADSRPAIFAEINRVLQINGCFMASTLGPDSFKELRTSWGQVDSYTHVMTFDDMHDLGDILLHEQFVDPVVDMEMITLQYPEVRQILLSLKTQGVRNVSTARNPGLTGRKRFAAFEQAYEHYQQANGKYPLSYEVVYIHAWKGQQRRTDQGTETMIPVHSIGIRKG